MIRGQSKWLVGLLLLSLLTNVVLAIRLQYPAAWHRWRLAMIPPPQLTATDHMRGPANAATTLIVYTNYQCRYCSQLNTDLITLAEELDFRWAYRHHVDKNQALAFKAAEAAECAGEQDKFWEYSDQLFAAGKSLDEAGLPKIAEHLQLDMAGFAQCTSSGKHEERLIADQQAAAKQRISATPTYFINGKRHVGAKPYATLKQLLLN
jgi:protein-disulfide isomerase